MQTPHFNMSNAAMANDDDDDDESMEERSIDERNVKWRTSGAREILLDDLQRGILTLDAEEVSAEDAWDAVYSQLDAFELVPFSQFKRQLKAHRQQVMKLVATSKPQYDAFRRDQSTQQQHTHYADGRPIFSASPALPLLKADVRNLQQQQSTIVIGALQQSRPEYAAWDRADFTRRVYQEVRYWKFVNYLEQKRQRLLARATKKVGPAPKKRKENR
jgi:hypothetical protein